MDKKEISANENKNCLKQSHYDNFIEFINSKISAIHDNLVKVSDSIVENFKLKE